MASRTSSLVGCALLLLCACGQDTRGNGVVAGEVSQAGLATGGAGVLPPGSHAFGHSYAEWSARWWQWGLSLPAAGHPFFGCPADCAAGQSGQVWFLAGGPQTECSCTVPRGTALFFPLFDAECSTLETDPLFHGDTEAQQRACARFWADHIVPSSLFCEIDGVPVVDPARFRFSSPQFAFTAPTPWIFGDVGGAGTSVGDGYYILLRPLPAGRHTIHFGGAAHFSVAAGDPFDADQAIDSTFHVTY
jgi:hypothetical protein